MTDQLHIDQSTGHGQDKKKVKIQVDNHPEHIAPGVYTVADFKERVGVSPDKDLDQVIDGQLTTIADGASITITGGEVFFSHVRHGGSS